MRKVSIFLLALSLVVGFTFLGVAADMSDSNMEKGLEKSPVFEDTSGEGEEGTHFTHEKGTPRFELKYGKIRNGSGKLVKTFEEGAS